MGRNRVRLEITLCWDQKNWDLGPGSVRSVLASCASVSHLSIPLFQRQSWQDRAGKGGGLHPTVIQGSTVHVCGEAFGPKSRIRQLLLHFGE